MAKLTFLIRATGVSRFNLLYLITMKIFGENQCAHFSILLSLFSRVQTFSALCSERTLIYVLPLEGEIKFQTQ
jgi:hypothetical protein